jgi:hypothetical protein
MVCKNGRKRVIESDGLGMLHAPRQMGKALRPTLDGLQPTSMHTNTKIILLVYLADNQATSVQLLIVLAPLYNLACLS